GYERFAGALLVDKLARLPAGAHQAAKKLAAAVPARAFRGRAGSGQRLLQASSRGLPRAFLGWISYVPEPLRQELLDQPSGWAIEDYEAIWQASSGASVLDRLLDLNIRTYLLDDLLPKVDRMAMAHSL